MVCNDEKKKERTHGLLVNWARASVSDCRWLPRLVQPGVSRQVPSAPDWGVSEAATDVVDYELAVLVNDVVMGLEDLQKRVLQWDYCRALQHGLPIGFDRWRRFYCGQLGVEYQRLGSVLNDAIKEVGVRL